MGAEPKVQRLFPLPLMGSKTAEVESFASYIHRCAVEHGVSVGELIRFVHKNARQQCERSSGTSYPDLPNYCDVKQLVRPNMVTTMLVDCMSIMSGQQLYESTLWFIGRTVGRSSEEVANHFRWCPECLQEMVLTQQPVYFKLIWHMTAVETCPVHRTPLIDHCPACDKTQDTYSKRNPLSDCPHCHCFIGQRSAELNLHQIKPSWHSDSGDIVKLFEDLSQTPALALPPNGVKISMEQIFDWYWRHNREEDMYAMFPRDQLICLLDSERPVDLKLARRFAYQLGLSLYQLMNGEAHLTSAILNRHWVCSLPPSFMLIKSKERRQPSKVIKKVQAALAEALEPPSLPALARQVGVSVGYLEYRFPALVTQVVSKHQAFRYQVRLRKIHHAQVESMKFFFSEQYDKYPKSRKAAYRVLRDETGLSKHVLKAAIQTAYKTLIEGSSN